MSIKLTPSQVELLQDICDVQGEVEFYGEYEGRFFASTKHAIVAESRMAINHCIMVAVDNYGQAIADNKSDLAEELLSVIDFLVYSNSEDLGKQMIFY